MLYRDILQGDKIHINPEKQKSGIYKLYIPIFQKSGYTANVAPYISPRLVVLDHDNLNSV